MCVSLIWYRACTLDASTILWSKIYVAIHCCFHCILSTIVAFGFFFFFWVVCDCGDMCVCVCTLCVFVLFRLCVFCRWIKMGFNFIVNNLLSHTHFNSHSAHHPVESLYVDTYQSITLKTDNTIFNSQTHSLTHTQTNKTHSSFPPIHFVDSIIFLLDFFQYHSLFFSLYRLIVAWLIGWLVGWLASIISLFYHSKSIPKIFRFDKHKWKKNRDVNHWLPSFAHFFATDCFFSRPVVVIDDKLISYTHSLQFDNIRVHAPAFIQWKFNADKRRGKKKRISSLPHSHKIYHAYDFSGHRRWERKTQTSFFSALSLNKTIKQLAYEFSTRT